ncbi:caspase family protein [bacterium]|nr:MAG: caspase family protein [bacterium]
MGSYLRSFGALLPLILGATASADQALVVGIQEYRPLVAASTLGGCVNDANGMADKLKKDGFTVKVLLNADASRTGILGELERLSTVVKPDERFVFYFAGHGRSDPHYALMPSNCTKEGNDITTPTLHEAVKKIPARSRTVILDSCFSGGMSAGEMARGADDFKPRFFDPYSDRSIKFGPVAKPTPATAETAPTGDAGVCYYVAALSNEQALEGTMGDGKRHGLFTYALLSNLEPKEIWGDAHLGVKKSIGAKLQNSGRTQNPSISATYLGAPAFDPPASASAIPPNKTLEEAWNADNPDPRKIALKLIPEQDAVEAGRQIGLEIKVGASGYLVVLGEVDGRIYPFFPASGSATDAAVGKKTIRFPEGEERLFFDGFGADHVKAMLFSSAASAAAVLDALKKSNGQARDLTLARAVNDAPFTARLSMAVSDSLVGGLRLKDLDGLYRKIAGGTGPVEGALLKKLSAASNGYPRGRTWVASTSTKKGAPTRADKEAFLSLLNLAIQYDSLYDEGSMGEKVSKRVRDDLKKKPKGEKLLTLNRALLAELFPEEVNPDDARNR